MIEYSAGIVTAYGSAVRAGYTGTYEDFCRQQAQYAQNASAVEQAKQDAQTARNQAQTAKDDAVTAKNTAVSAKDDAVSAKNTAVSAKDDAVSAKNTASTKAQEASASATSAGLSATSASQSADDAEQSAQSVSGSLAQIQTNKEDIDTLKADLGEQDISFTPIDGKFINNSGDKLDSNAFAMSHTISVSAGTLIEFTATGYLVNVAMIAITDENEAAFTPVSISIDSIEHTYTYTTTEDCYIVVSYNKSKAYSLSLKAKRNNAVLNNRLETIEAENVPLIADAINMSVVVDNASVTIGATGKYINNNGALSSSANFNMSTPITLKKGWIITFNAIGYLTSVALLGMVNESGAVRTYTPIIVSEDSLEHTYSYTASIDISVVISSHRKITPKYTISTSAIQKLSADITNLKRGWVAFATIGVIGDSLASGASNYTGGTMDRKRYSWGKCIEREHGIDVSLFSSGGATTKSWLTQSYGLTGLNNADALDCYIIGLGVNDAYSLGSAYLGAISDINVGNENENGDTYYGNYSRIIAAIKAKSPRAKIICLTNPRATVSPQTDFNNAIKDIVELYDNTYLIDLTEDDFYTSIEFKSTWYGAHSTAVGYKLIAENLYNHLAELIQDNISDFFDIQWIAENHA